MAKLEEFSEIVEELGEREWDAKGIEARVEMIRIKNFSLGLYFLRFHPFQ